MLTFFRYLSDQGQGHFKVKVKMSCSNGKLLSQGRVCASMKEMGHQIKKLYSMLTFFRYLSGQGQGHFKIKVKMSCLNGKLSSQATLCASMKEMGHQIKKLYSMLMFFRYLSEQGQGHFKVKVNISCLNRKFSSQATLCARMKEMGHQIIKLYSMLTFLGI